VNSARERRSLLPTDVGYAEAFVRLFLGQFRAFVPFSVSRIRSIRVGRRHVRA